VAIARFQLVNEDGTLLLQPDGDYSGCVIRGKGSGKIVEIAIPEDMRSRLAHQLMHGNPGEMLVLRRRR
jgi:hypothetical protein